MKFPRKLAEGDIIESKGVRFKIKEILFQDCYNCDWDESRSYVDIEFKDLNGGYHHWKSNLDGGKVIYRKDIILSKYLDKGTGRFHIPFSDVDADISHEILSLMKEGYALSAYNNGYEDIYTLFKLKGVCSEYKKLESKELKLAIYDLLHNVGCHFFSVMSLDEYFANDLYQTALDKILLSNNFKIGNDWWRIVVRCPKDGGRFDLFQAKNIL